ncbi:hypothetical protein N2152v2_007350 [Parachlorella kessleri]
MADFTFPALPQLPAKTLPKQNPLMAKATVVDLSSHGRAAPSPPAKSSFAQLAGQVDAVPPSAAAAAGQAGAQGSMPPPEPRRRKKVLYEKGYSQVDWVRLTAKNPDLAGLNGQPRRRNITMEEVAQHASEADAWTVLRGRVYNITPYLRFHPGGVPMLLKVAGRDGTALFNKYHAWVNSDFLLEKCLVGFLQQQAQQPQQGQQQEQQQQPAGR